MWWRDFLLFRKAVCLLRWSFSSFMKCRFRFFFFLILLLPLRRSETLYCRREFASRALFVFLAETCPWMGGLQTASSAFSSVEVSFFFFQNATFLPLATFFVFCLLFFFLFLSSLPDSYLHACACLWLLLTHPAMHINGTATLFLLHSSWEVHLAWVDIHIYIYIYINIYIDFVFLFCLLYVLIPHSHAKNVGHIRSVI